MIYFCCPFLSFSFFSSDFRWQQHQIDCLNSTLQSLNTKATKHASVNISLASAPRPVLLLAVCWSSEWPIVCPMADCFVLCCWTWRVCCGKAAVPACVQQRRTGLRLMFLWGCQARSAALAQHTQFTSFNFAYCWGNSGCSSGHLLGLKEVNRGEKENSNSDVIHLYLINFALSFYTERKLASVSNFSHSLTSSEEFAFKMNWEYICMNVFSYFSPPLFVPCASLHWSSGNTFQ